MAFRFIKGGADVVRDGKYHKPRLLLVEPQRLFADRLRRLLEPTFQVHSLAADGPLPNDVIVIDTDATPMRCIETVVARNRIKAPVCLLSVEENQSGYPRRAGYHVLSKGMDESDFLGAVTAISQVPRRLWQSPFLRPVPYRSDLHLSSSYVFASPGIGGDWYDVFETDDRIAFSIGDVAGHGADALNTANVLRRLLIELAMEGLDPASILQRANAMIVRENRHLATAICGYIDAAARQIVYATAGHPAPILAHASNGVAFLNQSGGVILGAQDNALYPTFRLDVAENTSFVLYTDGVVEQNRDLFDGERRLLHAVRNAVVSGVSDAALAIQEAVFEHHAPVDDAAILAITFGERTIHH